MYRKFIIIPLVFLSAFSLYGQVTVTGHITAEIIEGVAVSPHMSNGFEVDRLSDDVLLGEVTVSTDESLSCNVLMEEEELINQGGNIITFTPSVAELEQKLRFYTCARNLREQKAGMYRGSFSVMLLYE